MFIDAVVVTVAVSVAVGESSEKIRILREIADAGGADGLVNRSGKVFGAAVSVIATTRLPANVKFAVADEVFKPMVTHVECLRLALFDGVVGETVARAVVDLQRRWVRGVGPQ